MLYPCVHNVSIIQDIRVNVYCLRDLSMALNKGCVYVSGLRKTGSQLLSTLLKPVKSDCVIWTKTLVTFVHAILSEMCEINLNSC